MPKGKKGGSKTAVQKKTGGQPKTKIRGTGTIGVTCKPMGGRYYNVVDSLDGIICPFVPQGHFVGPSKAPREPPCCPPSTCCYPPPSCPQQRGRRCC